MPELPEVESIKNQLKKLLKGHKIEAVEVKNRKIFQGDEKKLLRGKFLDARRFGKVTVIDLDNGYSIIAHLKLTGQFIYQGPNLSKPPLISKKVVGGIPGKHTHLVFKLDKGGFLFYNDFRKFGWVRVVKTSEVENEPFIEKLGPEPFNGLTLEKFKDIVCKSKRPIKIVLMDQTKIGGIGNIYANDALWLAKIDPGKKSDTLKENEKTRLFDAIIKVLKEGIKYGGASELAFVTPDGSEGEYQDHTLVYGREGELCKSCKTEKIKKIMLGGRGTYFCPKCQK